MTFASAEARALEWLFILLVGAASGTLGGIVGFGASIMMLPVLIWSFGAKQAVPIMAIAALMANASRAAVWWRDIDWKLNLVYCAAAVPAAIVGARSFLSLDAQLVEGVLGAFLLAAVPGRRWLIARGLRMTLAGMAVVGAAIGFLTGVVASTGPINTPFFLAYGLTKGSFVATEAIGSAAISLAKIATFHSFDAIPPVTLFRGLCVGSSLMAGSWASKRILLQMDASRFQFIIEAMMVVAGSWMIYGAAMASTFSS